MKSSTKGKLATFCIATGVQYLVNVFLDFTWDYLYKKICWKGKGMDEKGYETRTNNLIIAVNRLYFRSTGVETLLEDPSKAKEKLDWEPKITLEEIVYEMTENDSNFAKRYSLPIERGFKVSGFSG